MESTVHDSHAFVEQRLQASNASDLFDVGELAEAQYSLEQEDEVEGITATSSAARNDEQPRTSRKRAAGAHSPPFASTEAAASQVSGLAC